MVERFPPPLELSWPNIIEMQRPDIQTLFSQNIDTHSWYKKRAHDLYDTDYVPDDLDKAMKMVQEEGEQMPIGIFYQKEKPILSDRIDVLKDRTLLSREFDSQAVQNFLDKQ